MDFYTLKSKLFLMQLFFVLLITLFITIFRSTGGVLLSLFFFILIIKTLPDLFISEPVKSFNNRGIETSNKRNKRYGLILWDDINLIRVGIFRFNRFLTIEVKNLEEYRERVRADKGVLLSILFQDPSPYITLSFDLLTPSLNKSLEYINAHHPDKLVSGTTKK